MTSADLPVSSGNLCLSALAEGMVEDRNVGKYSVSVASTLTEVSEHRLRAFEAAGLLEPQRTQGGTRLYSDADLNLIRTIAELSEKGINYAGIREVLEITLSTEVEDSDAEEETDGKAAEQG